MTNFIKEILRSKKLVFNKLSGWKEMPNLSNIKSVGFIISITNSKELDYINDIIEFFNNHSLDWAGVVVIERKGITYSTNLNNLVVVNFESLNWIGIPKERSAMQIVKQRRDLFFCFNEAENFTTALLTKYINANCVVGMRSSNTIPYTFVMEGPNKTTLAPKEFLKQTFHYLNIINKE